MSLNEGWDPKELVSRGYRVTHLPAKNVTPLGKAVSPQFADYRANEEIPCWPYEKAVVNCFNMHGFMTKSFFNNAECLQASKWFETCVNNVENLSIYNKYFPERLLKNTDKRPVLSMNEII